jgi:predicted SnoaL-like aldol condensation-catalyzing enzyme
MSDQTKKNMQVLRYLFDTMNKGDIPQTRKVVEEVCTEDYLLHDPSTPDLKPGIKKYLESFDQFWGENTGLHVVVEDMFGDGDKTVTRGCFEYVENKTQEKKKMVAIFISRFENGKIAEEWQVTALVS